MRQLKYILPWLLVTLPCIPARAEGTQAGPPATDPESAQPQKVPPLPVQDAATSFRPRDCELFCYVHLFGGLGVGSGLRLNNPFRLRTQLGSTPESLSLTATFADVWVAATFGDPFGLQHGLSLNTSIALEDVPQEVLAPSYVAVYRRNPRFSPRARVGLPIILRPDANVGVEAALGLTSLVWSGLGVYVDVVYSVFQGAATDEASATTIPVLSLQGGVALDYEVLP